jgi:2-oxoglutarate dehydrogenase E2 component (dihydrolipoamide succinyltransferase)
MSVEIRVPQLPESVADATLVAWRKQPGEAVRRDENLADLETDKVVLEVPAPSAGVLREIKVAAGTTVKSGAGGRRRAHGGRTQARERSGAGIVSVGRCCACLDSQDQSGRAARD